MSPLKKFLRDTFYALLPKEAGHKFLYWRVMHKPLNLKNPKDFNEKLQWLIVHMDAQKMAFYADKIAVRDYVRQKGYGNILTVLYGPNGEGGGYNKFEEIDFDKLPEKFVLKCNHGSGGVFICTDKKTFDFEEAKKALNKNLKNDYSKRWLEHHYHYIKPQIMCEQYLEMEGMKNPLDYKIYCFDGKAECFLLCSEREEKLRLDYYDSNWNPLNYATDKYKSGKAHPKPEHLEEMIKIAEDLSQGFPYVRVDLYDVNGKIYFGELTLTPARGMVNYNTQAALDYLGSKLKLPFER